MESECCFTRSIIDVLHSWDIQGNHMERESSVTRSFIDQLHSWDIQLDLMQG